MYIVRYISSAGSLDTLYLVTSIDDARNDATTPYSKAALLDVAIDVFNRVARI